MNIKEMVAACEAVLFASGEPVSLMRICEIFEVDEEAAEGVMNMLSDRLVNSDSGIKLVKLDKVYQLCTREEYVEYIRKTLDLRRKTPLSQAAFEVLAVIAYNQPVTKAYVEQVRGVDCSGVVSTLVEKGLLEEKGRLELPGRPLIYGTTDNFLRCFSLKSLDELPEVPADEDNADANGQIKMMDTALELANQLAEDIPIEED
ncbi:MAG: SMC-Scp complex subunit ScpB [Oscillospiraceae bacterium]|nr:SMC-Scp complex subunit ScpB [Oscillospiraceae bacterium]